MKKIASIILAVLVVFGTFSIMSYAADIPVLVEYADDESETTPAPTVKTIDKIEVDLSLSGKPSVDKKANYTIKADNTIKIVGGKYLDFTIVPKNGYEFATNAKVCIDGKELDSNYTLYNDRCNIYGMYWTSIILEAMYSFFPALPFLVMLNITLYGFDAMLIAEMYGIFNAGILG